MSKPVGANHAWRFPLKNNNPRVVLRIPVSVSDLVQRLSTDTSVSGVVPDQIDATIKLMLNQIVSTPD